MVQPMFDYSKLKGRIKEVCSTQENYAKHLGLSRVSVSLRLTNQQEFTQAEILRSAEILRFPVRDIPDYFFTPKVQIHEQSTECHNP